ANYTRNGIIPNQFEQEYTVKIEHKITDKSSISGFYLYNRTNEPNDDYFAPGETGANRFADPNDYILQRRPQVIAINNTNTLSPSSVLSLRFGWTRFPDNNMTPLPFHPSPLPVSPSFLSLITTT